MERFLMPTVIPANYIHIHVQCRERQIEYHEDLRTPHAHTHIVMKQQQQRRRTGPGK